MLGKVLQLNALSIMAVASDLVTLWPVFTVILKGAIMLTTCSGLDPVFLVGCGCALRVSKLPPRY